MTRIPSSLFSSHALTPPGEPDSLAQSRLKALLMKTVAALVSLLSLMAMSALSSVEAKAESSNYPGDLAKGKHLTIYIEGLADPSSGFFRVLNNGAQQAGKDLGVDVKYVYPASVDLASYTEKIEETIAAKPDGISLCLANSIQLSNRASSQFTSPLLLDSVFERAREFSAGARKPRHHGS